MIKKVLAIVVACTTIFAFSACGGEKKQNAPSEKTIEANSKNDYPALNAIDGNIATGWIGKKKANETNPQVVTIDLGVETDISKITIDDTFSEGFTNKKPEFLQKKVSYNRGDATSTAEGSSIPFILNGKADGKGWTANEVATKEMPQKIFFSLRKNCDVTKLVLDNAVNNSVFESLKVYYSSELLQNEELQDLSKYTLLYETNENKNNVLEIKTETQISIRCMLVEFIKQVNEGIEVAPSLDEIFFYAPAGEDYKEPHNPVRFQLMGSNDGNTYDVFVDEKGNYSEVWIKELEEPVKYRYIKYLLFEEAGNNYPSIGEIIFE